ncbi:diacylglycerol kinase family lipid kinase [bacterium]|nr:diacylglycerol kinase family lipid kinase [bacterium]
MRSFKTMVIVNPNSAGGRGAKIWPEIRERLAATIEDFAFTMTAAPGDATTLTRQAIREGYEMIVSLGGDGTHSEVVNGFFDGGEPVNPDTVFGIIPCGTGGDLRKTMRIPKEPIQAVGILGGRGFSPIDVGHMTYVDHAGRPAARYFINIASFGLGGEVSARVNGASKLLPGTVVFAWHSLVSLLTYRNKKVRVAIDGRDLGERKLFAGVVANGRFFGGGMKVAPWAKIDDGYFDVILVCDLGRMQAITQMLAIYKGTHINHKKVEVQRARTVEVSSAQTVLHDVDGEAPGRLPSVYRILPGALRAKM